MKPIVPILLLFLAIISCKPAEVTEEEKKLLLALVQKDDKFGYVDVAGKYLIESQYEEAAPFSDGYAAVDIDGSRKDAMEGVYGGKYGLIDIENEKQFEEATFSNPVHFYNGFAEIKTSRRKKGLLSKEGTVIVKEAQKVGEFSNGLAFVDKKRRKPAYVDTTGKKKIELSTDGFCGNFSEGLACVESRGKYGFIDTSGEFAIKATLAVPSDFIEGRAAYLYKGKYGFIDKSGETIINPEYEDAADFSQGLCAVQQNGQWGFIDKLGRVVIEFEYEFVGDFNSGLAPVRVDEKMGYINKKGKLVIAPQYKKVHPFYNGFGVIEVAGRLGFIDTEGMVIIPPQFTAVSRFLIPDASNSAYHCRLIFVDED